MSEQHVIDLGTAQLRDLFDRINPGRIFGARLQELMGTAFRDLGPPPLTARGREASDLLERFVSSVEAAVYAEQGKISAARWLWYLRRLPTNVFAGSYAKTRGYDGFLAESVTWFSPRQPEASIDGKQIIFAIDEGVFVQLCRHIAAVKLLSQLHITYRMAGKGAVMDLSGDFPEAQRIPSLQEAVRTYDQRVDNAASMSRAGLGLAPLESSAEEIASHSNDSLIVTLHQLADTIWLPARTPDGRGGAARNLVAARYGPQAIDGRHLLTPFGQTLALEPDPALEPLLALLLLYPILVAELPWVFGTSLQFGYFAIREPSLHEAFEDCGARIRTRMSSLGLNVSMSPGDWMRALESLQPTLWPLAPGGILRRLGDGAALVDIHAASTRFYQLLVAPRFETRSSEARGRSLEQSVRAELPPFLRTPP